MGCICFESAIATCAQTVQRQRKADLKVPTYRCRCIVVACSEVFETNILYSVRSIVISDTVQLQALYSYKNREHYKNVF